MLNSLYKFIFKISRLLCHQKAERSFFINGYQFPICARCTGIAIGFVVALFLLWKKIYINIIISAILFLIMFIDWLCQYLKIKKSNNTRRFITGLTGGFGMSFFYYYIIIFLIGFIQ